MGARLVDGVRPRADLPGAVQPRAGRRALAGLPGHVDERGEADEGAAGGA